MGLAEPRKRLKISHDPNNLTWSLSANSYGQRLMLSQGWKSGQGLGAKNNSWSNTYEAAKVNVSFKDDTLGLGASLKSKDIEHSRTGLDAFQGLLGRLNGKSDTELAEEVKKTEDRNLVMYTQGKWGGMTFVPGGLLVQGDDYRRNENQEKGPEQNSDEQPTEDGVAEETRRKVEKRRRKEERRRRKMDSATTTATVSEADRESSGEMNMQDAGPIDPTAQLQKKKKRRKLVPTIDGNATTSQPSQISTPESEVGSATAGVGSRVSRPVPRNGRHILRGRNIEAKKMAIADAKMLDEIFMRRK